MLLKILLWSLVITNVAWFLLESSFFFEIIVSAVPIMSSLTVFAVTFILSATFFAISLPLLPVSVSFARPAASFLCFENLVEYCRYKAKPIVLEDRLFHLQKFLDLLLSYPIVLYIWCWRFLTGFSIRCFFMMIF